MIRIGGNTLVLLIVKGHVSSVHFIFSFLHPFPPDRSEGGGRRSLERGSFNLKLKVLVVSKILNTLLLSINQNSVQLLRL